MKKIILRDKEKVVYKVKFSKRSLFLNIMFLIFLILLTPQVEKWAAIGVVLKVVIAILFLLFTVIAGVNFYRIFFHRCYLTNFHLIYVKGYYLKSIKYFLLDDLTGVYFKSRLLDRAKNMTTFRLTFIETKPLILKDIKDGKKVAEFLSSGINKKNDQYENQTNKVKKGLK